MRILILSFLALLAPVAGAAPEVTLIPTPDGGIQPVAEADADGNIHLVYFRGEPGHGGDLAFVLPGTTLQARIPHGKAARKYPSIALAPDGHVLVAWLEGAGWEKAGPLGWQLFDAKAKPLGDPQSGPATPVWSKPAAVFDGERFVIIY